MNSETRLTLTGVRDRGLSVAAVVVTFNPDVSTMEAIVARVRPQVDEIVMVDNGSAQTTVEALEELAARYDCTLHELGSNLGIAAAQNRGIEVVMARTASADTARRYVLFLDHDSVPAVDMVQCLLASDVRQRQSGQNVGAVGPVPVDKRTGTPGLFVRASSLWIGRAGCLSGCDELTVDFLISSGTLVRTDVLANVGMMNEGLFIDHVDTEWCLRATALGYLLYGVCDARLAHSLGDEVVAVKFGRRREVFVHSATRDYYMFRNTVLLLRGAPMRIAWRLFLSVRLVMFLVFFGVCVPPRRRRLKLMSRGLVDGFLRRTGKLQDGVG